MKRGRGRTMSVAEALAISGGLSAPGKMSGHAYSLPAESVLQHLPRSVCARCYALRGRYRFSRVGRALRLRLRAISNPRWVDAVATLIARSGEKYFRWHDAGDLQGAWHLRKIIAVCRRLPRVTEIAVTDRRMLLSTGVLVKRRAAQWSLQEIDSIEIQQADLGRMLDYGSIVVHAAGKTAGPFRYVSQPFELRRRVEEEIRRAAVSQKMAA